MKDEPTLRVIEEREMPADLDLQIRQVLMQCFPNDLAAFGQTRAWHGSSPSVTVIARDCSGQVVGHMGLHERTIDVGDAAVRVAGLQNVCVVPSHRKSGLFERLMAATMPEAAERGYDVGLLFCLPALQRVYARVGWVELPGRATTRIDEKGVECGLPNNDVPMFYPLKVRELPTGDIHLRGNDW
ncbi:MAG TPA: GNAT family N-acetyltransferase [Tepidisphaeraceae bacterium]|jgi:predicted N-acetyltransferase YhbS|nr:GNAT family N-acetyltransferase [Tepidisphaeraceae bacterium]